jgi:hypothetical protein
MASKTFLNEEINKKDNEIHRLKEVNIAINKKLNEKLLLINKLEGELIKQKETIMTLSKKKWFKFW